MIYKGSRRDDSTRYRVIYLIVPPSLMTIKELPRVISAYRLPDTRKAILQTISSF
ncbi:hypothetical protein KBB05_05705 [Patescibacteria group bacterium]|nr:hypothetical protein [Patescibacteria group bacterium]